ncbi:MAG TPA: acyltransferase [Humisphaera sp.]|jgi:peptidoglycan/LPS O-acetylase OafA/YrhL|nr:acyltransferase [Humisphaera sp.]
MTALAEKPQAVESGRAGHLAALDGLRAMAALYVVLHHAWMIAMPGPPVGRAAQVCNILLSRGHVAVDLFIVLSGFCLMLPVSRGEGVLKGTSLQFFKRRARRILPPYYAALALSLVAATTFLRFETGSPWDGSIPVTAAGIINHALLIHEWFRPTSIQINGPLWSVGVEWKIYFLFPLLIVGFRKYGPVVVATAAVILSYALLLALRWTPINTATGGVSAHYIGLFALGMLAAEISTSSREPYRNLRTWMPMPLVLVLATIACVVASRIPLRHEDLTPFNDLFVGIWSAILVMTAITRPKGIVHRVAATRWLVFAGTFSYSIYLLHMPLLQAIWQYGMPSSHRTGLATLAIMTAVAIPITLLICYLFFLAFEKPFLRARKGRTIEASSRDFGATMFVSGSDGAVPSAMLSDADVVSTLREPQ